MSKYDFDWNTRMEYLLDIMELPGKDKPMRKLQKEALRVYPVSSQELARRWLSISTMIRAGDLSAKRIIDNQGENHV